jgi:hypothetical protein
LEQFLWQVSDLLCWHGICITGVYLTMDWENQLGEFPFVFQGQDYMVRLGYSKYHRQNHSGLYFELWRGNTQHLRTLLVSDGFDNFDSQDWHNYAMAPVINEAISLIQRIKDMEAFV